MQQRWCGCGSEQRACVRQQAAAAGGMIPMDGRQPACVRQWVADAACVRQWAEAVACVGQGAAVVACVRQQAEVAGSTIAMEDSDGSGQHCNGQRQPQWHKGQWDGGKVVMNNGNGDGQLWVMAGVGGRSG